MTDFERELFFGIASDRLRRRTRWAGVVLTLSFLIPYEHVDGVPQFLWQLLGELPPAAIVAAFSTSAAGLAILSASFLTRRASALSLVVIASLVGAWLLERLGADRAAWDVLPLPESLTDRPVSMMLGLALVGGGINVAFKPHARRAGRILLACAALLIAAFYLWPSRGEAPIATIARVVISLPFLPGFRFMLGYSLILLVMLFPAAIAILGALLAWSPPSQEPRLVSRLVTFGLPALLGFFVFRSLLLSFGDSSLPATIGGVALLAALLGVLSAAIEVLTEVLALSGDEPGHEGGKRALTRGAILSAAALVVISVAQFLIARPPDKGVDWQLATATPAGDLVFGSSLEQWSAIRLRWDDRVRDASSASEMVELKAAEREVKERAAALDPNVRRALSALLLESQDLDLAGRRWFRLVADVNEANRAAGSPYYIDPSVSMFQTPDGLRRRFAVHGYRIERVRPVQAGSERYATLHVRRLGKAGSGHGLLGFSRDLQPFALVVLDEIEPIQAELLASAKHEPPTCAGTDPNLALVIPGFSSDRSVFGAQELEKSMLDCGRMLADFVKKDPAALLPALVAITERHELQHQIDGPHLPLPSALLERMGGYTHAAQEHVNRELSAYIAELTTPDVSPKLSLIPLLRFTRSSPRSALHHVSVLAIEALVDRELGTHFGSTDPAEISKAFSELFALDDAALRQRSADAWKRLYEAKLPEIRPGPT